MTKFITDFYTSAFKEALWLIGIATINFILGFVAIAKWGDVGAGILVISGGFAIYQIIVGFWVVLVEQNRVERKVAAYEYKKERFIKDEIHTFEKETQSLEKNRTYTMIGFLLGMLCFLMGAFGGWSELLLGIGVGLIIQCAIMLILSLFANYRINYYLIKLRKRTQAG